MTSAARQKVDRFTMALFDAEVERPDHDRILTRLYEDDSALKRILMELHNLEELTPFSASDNFDLYAASSYPGGGGPARQVSLDEATHLTGIAPVWRDLCPVRIDKKRIEVLMHYATSDRSYRLIGFVDLGVRFHITRMPYLRRGEDGKVEWTGNKEERTALVEVKGQWPSNGALIRQLNLYSAAEPGGFSTTPRAIDRLVVGPDESVLGLVAGHGYRLVTYSGAEPVFSLVPPVSRAARPAGGAF